MNTSKFTEKDLTTIFLEKISLKHPRDLFLEEVDCGQGRADIVRANLKTDISFTKSNTNIASILQDSTSAKIISLLHYKSYRTIEFIYNALGLQKSKINSTLKKLIFFEVILETKQNCYILHPKFIIPDFHLVSYELKLHNWKRALYQAIQYKGFTNKSFVVMPNKFINSALSNKNIFKINNIGLISVMDNGEYKIILDAKRQKPKTKYLYLKCIGQVLSEWI